MVGGSSNDRTSGPRHCEHPGIFLNVSSSVVTSSKRFPILILEIGRPSGVFGSFSKTSSLVYCFKVGIYEDGSMSPGRKKEFREEMMGVREKKVRNEREGDNKMKNENERFENKQTNKKQIFPGVDQIFQG